MAVISSFDRWRKDVFFSAAEEVQESADKLESVYRMWIRYRSDGFETEIADEFLREIRTALGTAKWQLEVFEKAVHSSHENCSAEENTITRHREFVTAIGNQVSQIEKAVRDSLVEEGKQPLRWVQLDEEERDDLAIFLSAAPQTSQEKKDKSPGHNTSPQVKTMPDVVKGLKENVTINKDSKYVVEVVAAKQPFKINGEWRTCSSPDVGAWKIMIADEDDIDRKTETRSETTSRARASPVHSFVRTVESTAKSKLQRNSFPKDTSVERLQPRQGLSTYLNSKRISRFAQGISKLSERSRNCFSSCNGDSKASNAQQLVGRTGGLQRHFQGSQYHMQLGRSLRITIFLLLTIILVVPFVLYST